MKNKDVKKIQLGGYSHHEFKHIRAKINKFDMDDEEVGSFKSLKKKGNKKYCTKTKGQHKPIVVKYEFVPGRFYNRVVCSECGYIDHFRTWKLREDEGKIMLV